MARRAGIIPFVPVGIVRELKNGSWSNTQRTSFLPGSHLEILLVEQNRQSVRHIDGEELWLGKV